jgi:AcrR family transcriptional regulator
VSPMAKAAAAFSRPRVEGDREQEVLDATIDVLAEVGYDRLTMDAVATRARASKATLYRRWEGKAALVIDAMCRQKGIEESVDTGSLRGDLIASFVRPGGLSDANAIGILGGLITAIARDEEFAAAFRRDFLAAKTMISEEIFARARERGELSDGIDVGLVASVLPGIVIYRLFVLGEPPTEEFITQVIDDIVLPASRA